MPKNLLILVVIFLLGIVKVVAQSYDLKMADSLYSADNLKDAYNEYEEAYLKGIGDMKLTGLTGLIKISMVQSKIPKGDSLLKLSESLIENEGLSPRTVNKFLLTKGEFLRKASRLEEAMEINKMVVERTAGNDSFALQHADALYYVALTFEKLTKFDSSLVFMLRSYDIYKEKLAPSDSKFGSIYNALGVCYHRLNQLKEAKSFYLQAISYTEKYKGEESSDLAMCLANLSNIYRYEEDYNQAIEYAKRSLQINKKLGDDFGISSAYYSLGIYYFYLGDYGMAKDYLKTCLEIREKIYPPDHYNLIGPNEVLGIAYEASGNYAASLKYLKKVRPIIASNYGKGSVIEGYNFENTSLLYKNIGKVDSAIFYMKKADAILTEGLPYNSREISSHYFSYATVLYNANKYREAQEMLSKSNQIIASTGLGMNEDFAENLALGGNLAFKNNDFDKAQELFERAFEVIKKSDGSYKAIPATLRVLEQYGDYLWSRYQFRKQDADFTAFKNFSDQYLKVSNQFRQQTLDSYTKSALINNNEKVFDNNIRYFAGHYNTSNDTETLGRVFSLSENVRASKLRDLQDVKEGKLAGYPDSLWEKEEVLKNAIGSIEEEILNAGESDSLLQVLVEKKSALTEFLNDIKQDFPRLYDLRFESSTIGLEDVQKRMPDDMLIIEYLKDDSSYYGIYISRDYAFLKKLEAIEELDSKIKTWQKLVRQPDKLEEYIGISTALNDLLLPASSLDSTFTKLLVVPTGPLFYLNFETLHNGDDFLIHTYEINYAISLDLYFKPTVRRSKHEIISIAPGFEDEIKIAYKESKDSLDEEGLAYVQTVRQPWSVKLAKKLSGRRSFTGLKANEAKVKQEIRHGEVLFFGTHAIANEEDPIRSKLLLAKRPNDEEDGLLHAYEIFRIPLSANLAVLTACESGLGEIQEGEGMVSLAYSLHFAGCPSTIMSLWQVDEKTSIGITEDFFDQLEKGKRKGQALRDAKLNYIEDAEGILNHPYYWGGLVFMGQDGRISTKSIFPFHYIFLILVALMTIVWALVRKRAK